jgi:hypothetical protein
MERSEIRELKIPISKSRITLRSMRATKKGAAEAAPG